MKTRIEIFIILFIVIITLTGGIYRHDRPIEKYLVYAKDDRFNCVGQLISMAEGKWKSAGSFVLIDSLTILSAAHCFVGESKRDTVVNIQGKSYKTYMSLGKSLLKVSEFRFLAFNEQFVAKSILLHPNYLKDGSCDIALIKLEKPVSGIGNLRINDSTNELKDTVTGVGYGVSGPANRIDLVNIYDIRLAGQNIIDSIGGIVLNGKSTMLYADFDSPTSIAGCNKIGDSKPLDLEYSIGAGDSGGPLFTDELNNFRLVGIATYAPKNISKLLKNGYYCEINGWTRVSAFNDWIENNR